MNSPYYNDVPETQGTARNKGTYSAPTARDDEDAAKLAAFRALQWVPTDGMVDNVQ